jgi:hypothetical protein
MVVGLGSQRDIETLCAITASVQAEYVRSREVEMLVSSEVRASAQSTNGREGESSGYGRKSRGNELRASPWSLSKTTA